MSVKGLVLTGQSWVPGLHGKELGTLVRELEAALPQLPDNVMRPACQVSKALTWSKHVIV